MVKKLFFSFFFTLFFLGNLAFAGFFEFSEPGFEEKVFKEEVGNGGAVSLGTVAADSMGNIYYLIDNMQTVIGERESFTFEELQEITYTVKIAKIGPGGEESIFAEGTFPLTTSVSGVLFEGATKRFLIFLQTLQIDEVNCPFISASALTMEVKGKGAGSGEPGKKVWNWSGLENCFTERLSIIEITGFRRISPIY